MFFSKKETKKSTFFPLVIFRFFLSLTIFLVLALLLYQALTYFSGASLETPQQMILKIKENPKGEILKIFSLEQAQNMVYDLVKLDLPNFGQDKFLTPTSFPITTPEPTINSGTSILKFAILTDSHNDNANLKKALSIAREQGAKFVIGLGDYTATGTNSELQATKEVFDNFGLPYYSTAGDHDLWDSRDKAQVAPANYTRSFGSPYQTFTDSNIRFIIVYNSDNYEGIDAMQMNWLENVLADIESNRPKNTFVFLHEPLYHPTSDRFMGKTKEKIKLQAQRLVEVLKTAGVNEVFAGDVHAYSRYIEPKSALKMTTVGALTTERNLQPPRFVMVDVLDSGSYNVEDVQIQ